MPRFSKSVRVPYDKVQAFDLVSDIGRYPDFIKWITAMRVKDAVAREAGGSECIGEAVVGFKGFVERFSTRVVSDPLAGSVKATLVTGPFRRLNAEWLIVEAARGTDITLDIDYEFKNFLIGMVASANHDLAVDRILGAFLSEAQRRFGATGVVT